ncbi:MAG: NADPH-dependent FMN reductase, partial [Pseudomonadota bacterium]
MNPITVLGIAGSLRARSFNRMALSAACDLAPEGMRILRFERIGDLPLYDEDLKERGFPEAAAELRQAVAAADALLFVTPEYNYSVSGVL